ncbi:Hypothetical protein D9617_4g003450 [Elsinoe fawcettii]|nr:Hypothetical protein D9617_4g003450 [Elsinoe fawcettii]
MDKEQVVFRPSKRRKTFRQRDSEDDAEHMSDAPISQDVKDKRSRIIDDQVATNPRVQIQKRHGAHTRTGVNFSSSSKHDHLEPRRLENVTHMPLAPRDGRLEMASASVGRFVSATGQVTVKDDKHMTAYIDSKLAEIHMPEHSTTSMQSASQAATREASASTYAAPSQPEGTKARHHIVEEVVVDQSLGDTTPTAARDRRHREPKPRLDRHGKPLPPRRPRGWRSEDDKARDSLVERLLTENRLEGIYDNTTTGRTSGSRGADPDADRRMAEEFEREFRANAEERRAKQIPAASKTAEPVSGPKLGGSKNARIAKK